MAGSATAASAEGSWDGHTGPSIALPEAGGRAQPLDIRLPEHQSGLRSQVPRAQLCPHPQFLSLLQQQPKGGLAF